MSTATLCTDCFSIWNFPSIGFGPEVKALKRYYEEDIVSELKKTETLGHLNEALQSLNEVFEECSEEGWDGYDALPITEEAYFAAIKLIKSLPVTAFPMPEVTPEPNGEIGLEWYREERQVFVASVSGRNEIVYAGLLGVNKSHGTEYFGDSLPSVILENLKRLYKD
ncbi:MAG: hypothetical protein ACYSWS_02165 [Planctomycetota bacterium]|jgi:hypothetical protein